MLNALGDVFRPTTPVDAVFDSATNEANVYGDVNWQVASHLCDLVNAREEGAKEAVRAIRRRMKSRNIAVLLRVFTLTQSMFDNCGAKFRVQLASRDFIKDFEKMYLDQRTDTMVRYRMYELLEGWRQALQGEPSLVAIPRLYARLCKDGPPPQVTLPTPLPPASNGTNGAMERSSTHDSLPVNAISAQSRPSRADRATSPAHALPPVDQGLEVMRNTCEMFTESLSFADSAEDLAKNELIQEFRSKCKKLHHDIERYLAMEQTEETTAALILANGEFLNAFKLYDDLVEQYEVKIATSLSRAASRSDPVTTYNPDEESGGSSSNYVNPFVESPPTTGAVKDKGKKALLHVAPEASDDSGRASPCPPPPEEN